MRIELPLPSWAEAQRAHDDAHTLTVPLQHPHPLPHPIVVAKPDGEQAARVEVMQSAHAPLTLTF